MLSQCISSHGLPSSLCSWVSCLHFPCPITNIALPSWMKGSPLTGSFGFLFLMMDVFLQGWLDTTVQQCLATRVWSLMGPTARDAEATVTVPTTVENLFLIREIHAPYVMLKASTIYNEVTLWLMLDGYLDYS